MFGPAVQKEIHLENDSSAIQHLSSVVPRKPSCRAIWRYAHLPCASRTSETLILAHVHCACPKNMRAVVWQFCARTGTQANQAKCLPLGFEHLLVAKKRTRSYQTCSVEEMICPKPEIRGPPSKGVWPVLPRRGEQARAPHSAPAARAARDCAAARPQPHGSLQLPTWRHGNPWPVAVPFRTPYHSSSL